MTDDMYASHRDSQGRFTPGNPGGGKTQKEINRGQVKIHEMTSSPSRATR